jgi:hypothetical protein
MKAKDLSILEKKIMDAVNQIAEDDDGKNYEGYYHDQLVEQMALGAAQVFDACMTAQKFAKEQGN